MLRKIGLIGAPSGAGARREGQELAPGALREAGLVERLRDAGRTVHDLGDTPVARRSLEVGGGGLEAALAAVADVVRSVAERVGEAHDAGLLPLVIGGDCTVGLGLLSGSVGRFPGVGLVYFDGDLDLNTPQTSHTGVLDGMVMAHALGHGADALSRVGPRYPLIDEERVTFFAYDAESGWIDPPELDLLAAGSMARRPLSQVRGDPTLEAEHAIEEILRNRADSYLVHFDVDVTRTPAVDVHHPRGMDWSSAFEALGRFVRRKACVGIVVTEVNPTLDPDGTEVKAVVRGLVDTLGAG